MFQRMFRQVALCGAFALLTSSASAQYFPGSSFDPCAPARPVASLGFAPVASTSFAAAPISASLQQQCVTTCQPAPLVPVAQQCYQTVPTVEYQEVKRTVERPVVETRYVDQTYTAYRPVSESRVAEVPTVNYQNVTEYQTVTRDQGQWVSHRECIQRPLPCQYDNRPGFLGGMNRFGYSLRSAFTPSFRTRREYIPNYVAQTVPVTRQVAIQGTRQVTYNVTHMQPYQATRKVAVNNVRMVAEQVTERVPVTVMKTVPAGTRVTYVSPSSLGTATAALSTFGTSRQASLSNDPSGCGDQGFGAGAVANGQPTPVRSRTADARNGEHFERNRATTPPYDDKKANPQPFRRDGETFNKGAAVNPFPTTSQPIPGTQAASQVIPVSRHSELFQQPPANTIPTSSVTPQDQPKMMPRPLTTQPPVRPSRSIPSIVRVNRWSRATTATPGLPTAPAFQTPGISVAVD